MTTDHGQLTLRDHVSYYLAKRRARKVMRRRGSPAEFIVITDRDDGRGHLVSTSVALDVYVKGFAAGFTAVCDATVHPPETGGWESGPSSPPKTGPLCQLCTQRLPSGAHIRRPVGELPAPRGEGRG